MKITVGQSIISINLSQIAVDHGGFKKSWDEWREKANASTASSSASILEEMEVDVDLDVEQTVEATPNSSIGEDVKMQTR